MPCVLLCTSSSKILTIISHHLGRDTCLAPEGFNRSFSGPWPNKVVHHCSKSNVNARGPLYVVFYIQDTYETHSIVCDSSVGGTALSVAIRLVPCSSLAITFYSNLETLVESRLLLSR